MPDRNEELHVHVPDYTLPYVNARVCLNARASARRKIRTKTAGSPENKNAPDCSHGPPFFGTDSTVLDSNHDTRHPDTRHVNTQHADKRHADTRHANQAYQEVPMW